MSNVNEVKDLEVYLPTPLSFRDHIINMCKKAYRYLGLVLRKAHCFKNIKASIVLFNALVRS